MPTRLPLSIVRALRPARHRGVCGVALVLAAVLLTTTAPLSRPNVAANGMAASPEPLATDVGVAILQAGGNAFAAAAAMQFALSVTYPTAGNVGGGGFMVGLTAEGETFALDFREEAPAAARTDMFVDADGQMLQGVSTDTHRGVGVPGSVDGMLALLDRYGTLARADILAPAIALARDGFTVS